jgi:hypothetical protein
VTVRLIVGFAGIVVGAATVGWAIWHWRSLLRQYLSAVLTWSIRSSEFWGLAETFLNEVAVLWFVFPVLDDLYDRAANKPPLSIWSILGAFGVAFFAFIAAVYCKKKEMKLNGKTHSEKGK